MAHWLVEQEDTAGGGGQDWGQGWPLGGEEALGSEPLPQRSLHGKHECRVGAFSSGMNTLLCIPSQAASHFQEPTETFPVPLYSARVERL